MEENMTYVTNEIYTYLLGCTRNTWEETAEGERKKLKGNIKLEFT